MLQDLGGATYFTLNRKYRAFECRNVNLIWINYTFMFLEVSGKSNIQAESISFMQIRSFIHSHSLICFTCLVNFRISKDVCCWRISSLKTRPNMCLTILYRVIGKESLCGLIPFYYSNTQSREDFNNIIIWSINIYIKCILCTSFKILSIKELT